jgi:prefoldin subunit 5
MQQNNKQEVERDELEIVQILRTQQQNVYSYKQKLENYSNLEQVIRSSREKLKIESMIPIGEHDLAFMPGELVHTNEWLVSLGENYFIKCTSSKALEILERRVDYVNSSLNKEEQMLSKMYGNFTGPSVVPQKQPQTVPQQQQQKTNATKTSASASSQSRASSVQQQKKPAIVEKKQPQQSTSKAPQKQPQKQTQEQQEKEEHNDQVKRTAQALMESIQEYKNAGIVDIREEYHSDEEEEAKLKTKRKSVSFADQPQQSVQLKKDDLKDVFASLLKEEEEENKKHVKEEVRVEQKIAQMEQQQKLKAQKNQVQVSNSFTSVPSVDSDLQSEINTYFQMKDEDFDVEKQLELQLHDYEDDDEQDYDGEEIEELESEEPVTQQQQQPQQQQIQKQNTFNPVIERSSSSTASTVQSGIIERKPIVSPHALQQSTTSQQQQPTKKVSKFKQMMMNQQQ